MNAIFCDCFDVSEKSGIHKFTEAAQLKNSLNFSSQQSISMLPCFEISWKHPEQGK